jgi:hypothetical protein
LGCDHAGLGGQNCRQCQNDIDWFDDCGNLGTRGERELSSVEATGSSTKPWKWRDDELGAPRYALSTQSLRVVQKKVLCSRIPPLCAAS